MQLYDSQMQRRLGGPLGRGGTQESLLPATGGSSWVACQCFSEAQPSQPLFLGRGLNFRALAAQAQISHQTFCSLLPKASHCLRPQTYFA